MSFADTIPFQAFWSQSWSAALRASCCWLTRLPGPNVPRLPDALAPGWLRPLCFQRVIANAVQARLAWRRAHPDAPPYVLEDGSSPAWDRAAWTPYDPRGLRGCRDEALLARFQVDLERLLRVMETPPDLPGIEVWTRAAMGACERLAQLYQELLRRCGMQAARRVVRRLLARYVCGMLSLELPQAWEDGAAALAVESHAQSSAAREHSPPGGVPWPRAEAWRRAWCAARGAARLSPEIPAG